MEEVSLKETRISVIGLARSGLAAAELAARKGAQVFASDIKPAGLLLTEIQRLREIGVEYETGGHTDRVLENAELIVVSPGVPPDIPVLESAREANVPIVSEIEFGYRFCKGRVVAVTGSNGKSTTVALTGHLLKRSGIECEVGGNIGRPFSSFAGDVSPAGVAVLELSSFQLELVDRFRPYVAVLLNITPDHLDRHADMESYIRAKLRIFENQGTADHAVLNLDDEHCRRIGATLNAGVRYFSCEDDNRAVVSVSEGAILLKTDGSRTPVIGSGDLLIRGPHNLSNACAAVAAATCLVDDIAGIASGLKTFEALEHRLEEFHRADGILFVNDSKGTNVDSVHYALVSVPPPIVLIMGGKDKGGEFEKLRSDVKALVKSVILIGEAAPRIEAALGDVVPVSRADSMKQAVARAIAEARPGDTVLLSPGCASFDMFDNYEHRGRVFKEAVREYYAEVIA